MIDKVIEQQEKKSRLQKYMEVKKSEELLRQKPEIEGAQRAKLTTTELRQIEASDAAKGRRSISQIFQGVLFNIESSAITARRDSNNQLAAKLKDINIDSFVQMARAATPGYLHENMSPNTLTNLEINANRYGLSLLSGTGRIEEKPEREVTTG